MKELGLAYCVSRQMTEEGRYFATRELIERSMSRRAVNHRAAAVHMELAERYEALAVVFGAKVSAQPGIHS